RVEARGKHLVIELDDGRALHTHLGMTGAWHVYRPGERWQVGEHLARLVLETDAFVAVCFRAPTIELLEARGAVDARLAGLGPDVALAGFDVAAAARRLRAHGAGAIVADALVDQAALSGVGNIWRSEALFAARVHPEAPVDALSDDDLARVARAAHRLVAASAAGGRPELAVYGRARMPCPACGAPVERRRVGRLQRSAYFCPRCQRAMPPA
ncbi:MAG TPA: DNA-formamidopyrimidine glycosylase family protein, partial [Minicystis sp.]|nr:DNA-formamidopyrimidine glycosylase family protein [Minicystis sp.]